MADIVRRSRLLPVLCFFLTFTISSPSQTIAIRLVNGKTGKPLTNKNVNVTFWGEDPASPYKDKRTPLGSDLGTDVYIDKTGIGRIEIPQKATSIAVREGTKVGKEPYRTPYFNCTEQMPRQIPIADVLEHGFIPGNSCKNTLKVKVNPGEFVFFGKPLPWWWIDME